MQYVISLGRDISKMPFESTPTLNDATYASTIMLYFLSGSPGKFQVQKQTSNHMLRSGSSMQKSATNKDLE